MARLDLTRIFSAFGVLIGPFVAFFLAFLKPAVSFRWLFASFILFHGFYRIWETFYTSKEIEPQKFEGDWTLAVGTFAYIAMCYFTIFEFFLFGRQPNLFVILGGGSLYITGLYLRAWGRIALGKQWAVHIVGKQKIFNIRLIKLGPYKYIRHPIYLGIFLDELAVPLIGNAYFALLFSLAICAPLLLIRTLIEERESQKRFGERYLKYRQEVGMLLPKKFNPAKFKNQLLKKC